MRKTVKRFVRIVAPAVIIAASASIVYWYWHRPHGDTPCITADADDLPATIVSAHLQEPIDTHRNVLWCATAQIAWNELLELNGEDLRLRDEPPMVPILNRKAITRGDLPPDCYIAMAGHLGDGILARIENALAEKFGSRAAPRLLPTRGALPPDAWVAYSYLSRNMPFRWAFERLEYPLNFQGVHVEAWGIEQYLGCQENERRAASQLQIYDYKSPDDFIIELTTRQETDRLILAKIPPEQTLAATIRVVQNRLASSTPTRLQDCQNLAVPVLDFDIERTYHELYDKRIQSSNPRFDGTAFIIAKQNVRFKLDETGATLTSEVILAGGAGGNIIFDKPFLVMIKKRGAEMPYFALWVANAELLVRCKVQSKVQNMADL